MTRQGCVACGRRTDDHWFRWRTPMGYMHFACYLRAGGPFRRA